MRKLALVPVLGLCGAGCIDQPLLPPDAAGAGGAGAGSAQAPSGGNGSSGSGTPIGGAPMVPGLGFGGGSAGEGGDGKGGSGGGEGGSGGSYPQTTTCAEYAAEFGTFGHYATANRMVQASFTLEAWINTSATSLTGGQFYEGNGLIYADVAGDADDFGLSILNDKVAFGTGNPETTVVGASDVNTGEWVHVAATRDAGTGALVVLVDGQVDGAATSTNLAALSASPTITIGGNSIDGRYFDGLVDEVRIWNVVRTPAEIQATMKQKLAGTEPGLVAYWSFDDAGATMQPDASPSNASATVNGPVGYVDSLAPVCD